MYDADSAGVTRQQGANTYRRRVTAQQAAEIAAARVPGQIIHVDLSLERGVLAYEVFLLTDQDMVYQVEVASRDGRILHVEHEV